MKKLSVIFVGLFLVSGLFILNGCKSGPSELPEDKESLVILAEDAVKNDSEFTEKLDIFKKLKEIGEVDNEASAKLQLSMREDINALIEAKNFEKGFEYAGFLLEAHGSTENGLFFIDIAKKLAKEELAMENYDEAFSYGKRALEVFWDEEAMDLKLTAEQALLDKAVAEGNIEAAKGYFDDIMYVTGLEGNEALAEKHRANAEKYADELAD